MDKIPLPSVPIKVFLLLQLVFTSWALAYPWLPVGYLYCHLALTVFALWVIVQPSNQDAHQSFIVAIIFALLNDCVCIGIYYDQDANDNSSKLRFAVAFSFFNLFLKPVMLVFSLVNYAENAGFSFDKNFAHTEQERGQYETVSETQPVRQQIP